MSSNEQCNPEVTYTAKLGLRSGYVQVREDDGNMMDMLFKCPEDVENGLRCQLTIMLVVNTKPVPVFVEGIANEREIQVYSMYVWLYRGAIDPDIEALPASAKQMYCALKQIATELIAKYKDKLTVEHLREPLLYA